MLVASVLFLVSEWKCRSQLRTPYRYIWKFEDCCRKVLHLAYLRLCGCALILQIHRNLILVVHFLMHEPARLLSCLLNSHEML